MYFCALGALEMSADFFTGDPDDGINLQLTLALFTTFNQLYNLKAKMIYKKEKKSPNKCCWKQFLNDANIKK